MGGGGGGGGYIDFEIDSTCNTEHDGLKELDTSTDTAV